MGEAMNRRKPKAAGGFTLVELVITAAIMSIVALAIGVVIVDGQTSWNVMYDRANSDVITDGYVARVKFDAVMRKASREKLLLGDSGGSVEVYYYADDSSTVPDRYARFYTSDGDLNLECGQLEPRTTLDVETVCGNVSACTFKQVGRSVQMILTLDDGTQTNTVVSSAVTQNQ
jgi:prepilin-type N-terminal cleavage/methylation domain-containing protein